MTTENETRWLTVPDLVELMGLGVGKIHRLLEERALVATRRDGVLVVPELFLRDGAPLRELKGTVMVLHDAGYGDDEAVRWLLDIEPSLGRPPIDALREGRKTEVRRIAQALAY